MKSAMARPAQSKQVKGRDIRREARAKSRDGKVRHTMFGMPARDYWEVVSHWSAAYED